MSTFQFHDYYCNHCDFYKEKACTFFSPDESTCVYEKAKIDIIFLNDSLRRARSEESKLIDRLVDCRMRVRDYEAAYEQAREIINKMEVIDSIYQKEGAT